MKNVLAEKAFSKIGKVFEINGRNVIVKVDSHLRKSNLFHNGNIYKNIGIGGLMKIEKDYIVIIGKVIKEYLKEIRVQDNIIEERFLELSVIGNIYQGKLKRGLAELPNLFNEVFILSEGDINKIYEVNDEHYINLGNSIFDDISIKVGINKLFASHIGIFGNTGSGKSNTLSYVLRSLNEKLPAVAYSKSKFILLDFNGEYTNGESIADNKYNINLSTRSVSEKLTIKEDWLDEEFWSILLQATEKTQKPFIKRTLDLVEHFKKDDKQEMMRHIKNALTKVMDAMISTPTFTKKEYDILLNLFNAIKSFFEVTDPYRYASLNRNYQLYSNGNSNSLFRKAFETDTSYVVHKNGNIYFNVKENREAEIHNFRSDLLKLDVPEQINYLNLFHLCMDLRIIYDLRDNLIIYENISPVLMRFYKRKKEIHKVFDFGKQDFIELHPNHLIYSISLKELNIDMKKMIPLLIVKKIYEEHKVKQTSSSLQTIHLVIDEAHNILSEDSNRESEQWKDYRLEVFEEAIKEGRKFGVFLIIASQRPSDISSTIVSQLHNLFIHRLVNELDLRAIARSVSFIDKLSFDSLPILSSGDAIFTGTATESPVLLKVPLLDKSLQPKSETIDLEKIWFDDI
ncbi:ATP-binding protein [Lysinibacillus sp. NPDC098008]|uniref:ATP-binding protein n=1 Tax=Lysinibacillus sp. NPDC098008 TaxID=3364146 RepID=UPI003800AF74